MRKIIFFVIGFVFLGLTGHSQVDDPKDHKLWLDAGVGLFGNGKAGGLDLNFGLNLILNKTQFKLSTKLLEELDLFGPKPSEKYSSVGILAGRGFSGKYAHAIFSGGIGITWGSMRGDLSASQPPGWAGPYYKKELFSSVSIPLEIDLMFKPFKFLGVGFSIFGDLNFKRSYFGYGVKIGIGKLH